MNDISARDHLQDQARHNTEPEVQHKPRHTTACNKGEEWRCSVAEEKTPTHSQYHTFVIVSPSGPSAPFVNTIRSPFATQDTMIFVSNQVNQIVITGSIKWQAKMVQ